MKNSGASPSIGASAAIFRADGRVLIIQRGKPPFPGIWSLPGGHIEGDERAADTARREVAEETGLTVELLGHLTHFDVPHRDATGAIVRTFGLEVFFGRPADETASPRAQGDALDARFVRRDELAGYPLTERCAELIAEAWTRLTAAAALASLPPGSGDRT